MRPSPLPLAALAVSASLMLISAACGNAQDDAEPSLASDAQGDTEQTSSDGNARTDTKQLLSEEIRSVLTATRGPTPSNFSRKRFAASSKVMVPRPRSAGSTRSSPTRLIATNSTCRG
jgi:hypothetical protein